MRTFGGEGYKVRMALAYYSLISISTWRPDMMWHNEKCCHAGYISIGTQFLLYGADNIPFEVPDKPTYKGPKISGVEHIHGKPSVGGWPNPPGIGEGLISKGGLDVKIEWDCHSKPRIWINWHADSPYSTNGGFNTRYGREKDWEKYRNDPWWLPFD